MYRIVYNLLMLYPTRTRKLYGYTTSGGIAVENSSTVRPRETKPPGQTSVIDFQIGPPTIPVDDAYAPTNLCLPHIPPTFLPFFVPFHFQFCVIYGTE